MNAYVVGVDPRSNFERRPRCNAATCSGEMVLPVFMALSFWRCSSESGLPSFAAVAAARISGVILEGLIFARRCAAALMCALASSEIGFPRLRSQAAFKLAQCLSLNMRFARARAATLIFARVSAEKVLPFCVVEIFSRRSVSVLAGNFVGSLKPNIRCAST